MRFMWLIPVLLIIFAASAWFFYRSGSGRRAHEVTWVANTSGLRELPAYARELARSRMGTGLMIAALTALCISLAILAASPVDRRVEHPKLSSRDIVLCLDASGSMLPYDGQILREFDRMVEKFEGERLSLQMWSAQTIVKFPLTDDYELIGEVLNEAARIIDNGYLGKDGDYVYVTPELSDYLQGVDSDDGSMMSSLIGDGIASCVLGFDHRDNDRSRTILLATDNEVMGEQIYTLAQAVQFVTDQGIELIALFPGDGGPLTAEGEQMKSIIESAGGVFFNASDPSAITEIVRQIEQQQIVDLDGTAKVVETDRPETAVAWAVWSLLVLLAVGAVRRL